MDERKPLVRIEHYRVLKGCGKTMFPLRYKRGVGFSIDHYSEPDTKGGETCAYVKTVDGDEYEAWSTCSANDNFCYRIGREIALGRLRKQLADDGLENEVAWR